MAGLGARSGRWRSAGVEAVLFDFDGTLVDASEAICTTFHSVLSQRGLAAVRDEEVRALIGRPLREIFRLLVPGLTEVDLPELVAAYRAAFRPLAGPGSRLLPTVQATVEALTRAGLKLAIVTTRASDGASLILGGKRIDHHFSTIIGLEHVVRPKPHPEPVLQALRALAVTPEGALMVGDTPDDVLAGRRAGTRTVGVATGAYDATALDRAGADVVVTQLAELLPLLGLRSSRSP